MNKIICIVLIIRKFENFKYSAIIILCTSFLLAFLFLLLLLSRHYCFNEYISRNDK